MVIYCFTPCFMNQFVCILSFKLFLSHSWYDLYVVRFVPSAEQSCSSLLSERDKSAAQVLALIASTKRALFQRSISKILYNCKLSLSLKIFYFSVLSLAEGFYSLYRSLHHTPLSDINFESLLFSTVSNQSVWNFASTRGMLISLIAIKLFEISRRKVWYAKLLYTSIYRIRIYIHLGVNKKPWPLS